MSRAKTCAPCIFFESGLSRSILMALKSFIEVPEHSHFPLENLPFGIFKPADGKARAGVAIGNKVLDLAVLEAEGHFRQALSGSGLFANDSLNAYLALGRPVWKNVREILQTLLSAE